jgi:hypothetical protein
MAEPAITVDSDSTESESSPDRKKANRALSACANRRRRLRSGSVAIGALLEARSATVDEHGGELEAEPEQMAAEAEPEQMAAEAEPEQMAAEAEPEHMAAPAAEAEPEHMAAPAAEAEPEHMSAEPEPEHMSAEPEPEHMAAEPEPEHMSAAEAEPEPEHPAAEAENDSDLDWLADSDDADIDAVETSDEQPDEPEHMAAEPEHMAAEAEAENMAVSDAELEAEPEPEPELPATLAEEESNLDGLAGKDDVADDAVEASDDDPEATQKRNEVIEDLRARQAKYNAENSGQQPMRARKTMTPGAGSERPDPKRPVSSGDSDGAQQIESGGVSEDNQPGEAEGDEQSEPETEQYSAAEEPAEPEGDPKSESELDEVLDESAEKAGQDPSAN